MSNSDQANIALRTKAFYCHVDIASRKATGGVYGAICQCIFNRGITARDVVEEAEISTHSKVSCANYGSPYWLTTEEEVSITRSNLVLNKLASFLKLLTCILSEAELLASHTSSAVI